MGEAKRRGSFEDRKKTAIARKKQTIIKDMGGRDDHLLAVLRAGIEPFISIMSKEEWQNRRKAILESLKTHPEYIPLEKAKPIRFREDEIGWYLFLCEQILVDPLCVEISQAQRILPYFVGIGERWVHESKICGLQRKIIESLSNYKKSPDGIIFEILVALSYAEKGWDVEIIEDKTKVKSPDMAVRKNGKEIFVECKRLDRRTVYSEKEQNEYLRIWDAARPILIKNKQWVWIKATFHSEVSTLPTDFLSHILENNLPIDNKEIIIHDSTDATIEARLIDKDAVNSHLKKYLVKEPSPMLNKLLGGDWAPENSEVTIAYLADRGKIVDCEAHILSSYINKIKWACGITRKFDSEISINKKARDITKLLSSAVEQVPQDKQSIIHIAAETLEGKDVELSRTEKVLSRIPFFVTDKPVLGVLFHRFQSNSRIDMLYEFDETVEMFKRRGENLKDIPYRVVVPKHTNAVNGRHWEIYD